jgi:hypothetical protein
MMTLLAGVYQLRLIFATFNDRFFPKVSLPYFFHAFPFLVPLKSGMLFAVAMQRRSLYYESVGRSALWD